MQYHCQAWIKSKQFQLAKHDLAINHARARACVYVCVNNRRFIQNHMSTRISTKISPDTHLQGGFQPKIKAMDVKNNYLWVWYCGNGDEAEPIAS